MAYLNYNCPKSEPLNLVKDWTLLQGVWSMVDMTRRIPRDINHRPVSIQNNSTSPIAIAILPEDHPGPLKPTILLGPKESRWFGVNPPGTSNAQWLHVLHPKTGKLVGPPSILSETANQFVIRRGQNAWMIQRFKSPSFRAA